MESLCTKDSIKQCIFYFIIFFKIVNFVIENTSKPTAKTVIAIKVVVPAFGNVAGGSASFNLGETSDVLD